MAAGRLLTWDAIAEFLCARDARFTLVSLRTGTRYTYRVRARKDGTVRFVSLLCGPDNGRDYAYMGVIEEGGAFHETYNTRIGPDAGSWHAFAWFHRALRTRDAAALAVAEFWHSGKCGRCGRDLTVSESVRRGLGPECWGRAV